MKNLRWNAGMKVSIKWTSNMHSHSMLTRLIASMTLTICINFEKQFEKIFQICLQIRHIQLQRMLNGGIISEDHFMIFNSHIHSKDRKSALKRLKYFSLQQQANTIKSQKQRLAMEKDT